MDMHLYVHWLIEDPAVLRRLDAIEALIQKQGDRIMAQLDDLKTALDGATTRLDALQAEATEILADLAAVIALLQSIPPSPDLTEAIAKANAVSDRIEGVRANLDARPPSPQS